MFPLSNPCGKLKLAALALCLGTSSVAAAASDPLTSFDPLYYPYPAQRNVVYGSRGMVATSNPLAAQAGLEVLKKGGNAVDAAIAPAAALTVVAPTSNGIGSDNFAILWVNGKIYGINGSGRSPKAMHLDVFKDEKKIPSLGWKAVTVPAAPKTWAVLAKKFGKLPLSESLAPAVSYARDGFTVQPTVAQFWNLRGPMYTEQTDPQFHGWKDTFSRNGVLPKAGELWKLPDHARTLELIGKTDADAFYTGEIARKIVEFSRATGGYITDEDPCGRGTGMGGAAQCQLPWL